VTDHQPFPTPTLRAGAPEVPLGRHSWRARLAARLFSGRLDEQLAAGIIGSPGSAIHLRAVHLESAPARQMVSRALRRTVLEAREGRPPTAATVPVHRGNVADAGDTIHAITIRLHQPHQVHARGMAQLRRTLSDGSGPLYAQGSGNLDDQLRAALAML